MTRTRNTINLAWLDLEFTHFQPELGEILEIAVIITSSTLDILDEKHLVIAQPDGWELTLDDWCSKTFANNGLIDRVNSSELSKAEAEIELLNFLSRYAHPKQLPLAGNSVGIDRAYLAHHMSTVEKFLSHRVLDVSSFKEAFSRVGYEHVYPDDLKSKTHNAFDDIEESLNEYRFYLAKLDLGMAS